MIDSKGFLDTTYGALVTSDAALGLLWLQHAAKQRAKEHQEEKDPEAGAKLESKRQKKRAARQAFDLHWALVRLKSYFEPILALRSFQERAMRSKRRFDGEHLSHAARLKLIDNGHV
ncbi:hypothetical protein BWQ96_05893 [Gracilariopsis chorda]|uniref:Uncharacterized protein n=1 Tax=Gracilariopsis chorda TaxID=448386 RepID=A0A2V3IQH6_9FLOR|nr:hypothetical protein BWQ96_05893 [Gracilariopsis chorda]|eukprot:PXF44329.1 hypothetical protein BWQ96_05893 [Gracilariopsis chorda]